MPDAGLVEERGLVDPVAVGPGEPGANGHAAGAPAEGGTPVDGGAAVPQPAPGLSGADATLLALIDRLAGVLEKGDLGELEVSSGGTTIILRAPSAIAPPPVVSPAAPLVDGTPIADHGAAGGTSAAGQQVPPGAGVQPAPAKPSVKAPLTGIYYGAPSPGATPYVSVGDHVSVGQIIGLIEAMKLFNEIKSDLAGRVVRICADNGALVKAKQPLIEVEPA
ncbi:MAG TPA: biotin/lipoyl-containing protein [Candidatus Limnocylindrales bacterium]|nr:biotin/lipoyl-containing protein [Candidatus Limnocylindrales bacterium]